MPLFRHPLYRRRGCRQSRQADGDFLVSVSPREGIFFLLLNWGALHQFKPEQLVV